MKLYLILFAALCFFTSCSDTNTSAKSTQDNHKVSLQNIDNEFTQFSTDFIESYWKLNPGYGVYVGYYKYDDQQPVYNADYMVKENTFNQDYLARLKKIDVSKLSPANASDYFILLNELESSIWYQQEYRSHEWDPSNYNVAYVIGVMLNTEYKSLNERLLSISKQMQNIPAYYTAAKVNIKNPILTHTKLAIKQNKGSLSLFDTSLRAKLAESTLPQETKQKITSQIDATLAAINDYVSWLETKLPDLTTSPNSRDFRIGKALYEQKFKFDIYSDYSATELYEKALVEKVRIHGEMTKLTDALWPKYFTDKTRPENDLVAIKALIDHLSPKHVQRDEFVASIRAQIPTLETFVIENNLLDMDKEKPLVVRETPLYQRGFAGASINAPGPYDPTANTYYNVTPLDDYDDDQAESYLREYNHWILQILNIHEAIPGHYTQLVHSNKSLSLVKSIFGNGAMIEGWAVYTERMMLEEGYGGFEPELWLMYYKWNLRVIMNSIIDYSIQVNGLGEQQAIDMMINQAFQETTEAQEKWNRATLSQVQLTSYFTGYSEIYDLREELKKATGDKFNLTDFHNHFLSYGSAPVPVIKKLMYQDYIDNHK